jgi:hypothetical protein
MGLKKIGAKLLSKLVYPKLLQDNIQAERSQQKVLKQLIQDAKNTAFGIDHNFKEITDSKTFAKQVPVREYEALKPYIERIKDGESDVLWKGKPIYFAKTSGTTSGAKYIPLTKESMPSHINAAKNALLAYIYNGGDASFVDGKMIFLQGSPIIDTKNGIGIGRLSGIVAHYVPKYLQTNRMPSWDVNCIEAWEEKVDAIAKETSAEDLRLISGIPPWVKMYFEKLLEINNTDQIKKIFKNFSLFVYGGVNFEPYRNTIETLVGKKVDSVELFPASEGFFAFQDQLNSKGMLLNVNAGMYFEFVPQSDWHKENPKRLTIGEVQVGENYSLIVSSNAGLWGYSIGDVVQFLELKPYRIIVSGRIKHYTSAFGEHVIASEVEKAMSEALKGTDIEIVDFTVSPLVSEVKGDSRHQWFIEFQKAPKELKQFSEKLQEGMLQQNIYYADLIKGKVLADLEVIPLKKGTFNAVMKAEGKFGGQNKGPRLSNNCIFSEKLSEQSRK